MTLPVAFPSRRDTGSCVCEGNKPCCVVCRRSAPAGGEGRPGCCQRGTALRAGGSAGARPAGCHSRPAVGPGPGQECAERLEAMRAGFIFPRHGVSERSALIILSSSACCSYWIPASRHPASARWWIHCCACPRGALCVRAEGAGAAACAGLALGLCSCGRWARLALQPFHPQRRWAPAPSLLEGLLAGLRVFLSVSAL